MKSSRLILSLIALSLSSAAIAGPNCTKEPKNTWLSEDAMKQKIVAAGYSIEKFKTTDGQCYEIYGRDKAGEKVEIYFNPVDGSIVKEKRG